MRSLDVLVIEPVVIDRLHLGERPVFTCGRAPAMSSTLGDLLREVAEPGPNRNSFHSTAHFPSGIARARARGDAWRIKFDLEFCLM